MAEPGQVVMNNPWYPNSVVNQLGEAARLLCHAIDPNQHSTTVRIKAINAIASSELTVDP